MQLTECNLSDLSSIRYSYSVAQIPGRLRSSILVVRFEGIYGTGCGGNGDATFMSAIIAAGIEAWEPEAIVLDLQNLAYQWGDLMGKPLSMHQCHGDSDSPLRTAVVVSDLNRNGLTSLLRDELFLHPSEIFFESLEEALTAMQTKVNAWYEEKTS